MFLDTFFKTQTTHQYTGKQFQNRSLNKLRPLKNNRSNPSGKTMSLPYLRQEGEGKKHILYIKKKTKRREGGLNYPS